MKHRDHRVTNDKTRFVLSRLLLIIGSLLLMTGCQMANPPRLATATAQAAQTASPTPEKLVLPIAATSTPETEATSPARVLPNPSLSVWVNETSPQHEATLRNMAAEFMALAQVDVELMFVSPFLLPDLVNTAVLSGTLPDVIIHPLEYTHGWAARGILDVAAADTAVSQIGRDTFDPAALELVTRDGQAAAVPSDGYHQLLIYRTDWFAAADLATPDNFAAMLAAAAATTDRDNRQNPRAGFVIPTESNLVSTHRAFEQIALASGCELIDEKGEVLLPDPPCRAALDFYFRIVNQFSPIGVQTDTSTRNAYLAGRTGLIMTSPAILPQLAGLDPAFPPACSECRTNPTFLAENSGILTDIQGEGGSSASFGNLTNLGITSAADVPTAVAFADYWFNDGYEKWLSVNSERKVPMRWGTATAPARFIGAWGTTPLAGGPSLADVYGETMVTHLREGIASAPRWGIRQGHGALITQLYEKLTLSVTLQEMLSGYFNVEQTIIEA